MTQVTPLTRIHSLSASGGGEYVLGVAGHAGLPELHAGVREVKGRPTEDVSIKRLGPAVAERPSLFESLRNELLSSSRASHPNVVRVVDISEDADGVWAVLERIDGICLSALLARARARRVRLPAGVIGRILLDVSCGLAEVHRLRRAAGNPVIAHRGLSCFSVFVGRDGSSRLLDLGLVHAVDRTGITERAHLAETLPYLAAEQLIGGRVGPASDTHSLAVLLWEMLTDRKLFAQASAEKTISAIVAGTLPGDFASAGAMDLEFLRLAVGPEASARFQSPGALAAAIEEHLPRGSAEEVQRWVGSLAPKEPPAVARGRSLTGVAAKPAPSVQRAASARVAKSASRATGEGLGVRPRLPPPPKRERRAQSCDQTCAVKGAPSAMADRLGVPRLPPPPLPAPTGARTRATKNEAQVTAERQTDDPSESRTARLPLVALQTDALLPPLPCSESAKLVPGLSTPISRDEEETRPERLGRSSLDTLVDDPAPDFAADPAQGEPARTTLPRFSSPGAAAMAQGPTARPLSRTTGRRRSYAPFQQPPEEQSGAEPNLWSLKAEVLPKISVLVHPLRLQRPHPYLRLVLLVAAGVAFGVLMGLAIKRGFAPNPSSQSSVQNAVVAADPTVAGAAVRPPTRHRAGAPAGAKAAPKSQILTLEDLPKAGAPPRNRAR